MYVFPLCFDKKMSEETKGLLRDLLALELSESRYFANQEPK